MSLDELIQAANQLNETELDQLLQQVVTMRARRKAPVLPEEEVLILQQINQSIPADLRQQYQVLREKREAETLTPTEHELLIELSKQIENFGAKRLESLYKLAQLRQVSLSSLMETLGIPNLNYA
jgi:nitric oxide reductase activation protein